MSAEDEVSKLLAGAVDSRGALPNVKQGKICDMVKEWTAATDKPFISFEYFPPKTEEGVQKLHKQIEIMAAQKPLFMDFTWGAGGTTSDLTLDLSKTSQKQHNLMVNMHLTCTNQVKEKCDFGLTGAKDAGICNIVALRGDPPKGQEKWEVTEGGFACALDLVKYMRAGYGDYFSIQVAGYPEGHPDNILPTADLGRELSDREKSRTVMVEVDGNLVEHVCSDEKMKIEIDYLKQKVDAGGDAIITQLFYDMDVFKAFVADCRAAGINVPIFPGIMPLNAYGGFKRMTGFCKTRIPPAMAERMATCNGDSDEQKKAFQDFGTAYLTELCQQLVESKLVPGLHFYCLNQALRSFAILKNLGYLQEPPKAE